MALIYRFTGDIGNDFQVWTDGVRALNPSNVAQMPDSFHITELRNYTSRDSVQGIDLSEEEYTRSDILELAQNQGYRLIEYDDTELLSTVYDPPRIIDTTPATGGNLANNANIVLTFSKDIAKATATGPTIALINLTSNTIVETFQFDSAIVTVATTNATINPTVDLTVGNQYALLINTGYFTNTGATENHGGIHDITYFNFTAVTP